MPEVELAAGTIAYDDTGGSGPVIVFLHGLLMDGSLWRHVVAELRTDYRCVVPTLPLGGHRHPMHIDADLSMRGIARLVGELLDRLDLRNVTLVLNDWGGAQLLFADGPQERIGRLVLTSCEAFGNVPPGLPGRALVWAARFPGGLTLALLPLRLRPLRRLPMTFGWMSKRPVPDDVMDAWLQPALTEPKIRHDLRKYLGGAAQARRELSEAADTLRSFDQPSLVVWATEDRVMPLEHGRRLASLLPLGHLIEIADSYTLLPEDQPVELATSIRRFLEEEAR